MAHTLKFGAFAGVIAAASFAITPASAAEIAPGVSSGGITAAQSNFSSVRTFDSSTFDPQAQTADWRGRRWGRRGWGRRGWRGRRGIRGGDVLAGVLVLGGIAAIASAANNNRRRDREVVVVDRDNRRYDDRRYDRRDDRRSNPRASNGSGIDNAVSQCLTEIERDVRVDSVDGASRLAEGWVVTGSLFNGSGFTCQIDNNGRISGIDYGGFSGSSYGDGATRAEAEGQLSAGRYADARAAMAGTRPGPTTYSAQTQSQAQTQTQAQPLNAETANGPQPAYPGGPLPGETFSE